MIKLYHVFTHSRDLFTRSLKEARDLFREWKEVFGCARLYRETYQDEEALEHDDMLEEDCILSFGVFPE